MEQTRTNVPHIPRFDIHIIKPNDKDYPECMKLVPHKENYDLISMDNLIVVPLVQVIDILSKRGE